MVAESYVYVPFLWLDQIIEKDESGNVVYEEDEKGNILYITDDLGNYVLDPITLQPIPQPRFLQVGTRHSAERENHQEEGIAKAHERIELLINRMVRVETQLEIDGRVDPVNKGTFFDNFVDAPSKLIRQTESAVLTESRAAGTTVLNVDDTNGLKVGSEVTIYDGSNNENTMITATTASTVTVAPLINSYDKGAIVARSSASVEHGKIVGGKWETYGVTTTEVV